MLYAQHTEARCCVKAPLAKPAALTATPAAAPTSPRPAPADAPHTASPAEAHLLTADAPVAATNFQFVLPVGVAPEKGLQVKTIWAARAISVLFPQITTIGGDRHGGPERPPT